MATPQDTQENLNNCLCEGCPTYPGNDIKLYCAKGKSEKKITMEGCICPAGCPVYKENKFKEMFYCAYGKAK